MEDLSMSRAATKGGVVMMLAIVGAPLGGYLTDRWMKRRRNARLLFPAVSSATTAVILLVAFGWSAGPVQYALLMGAGISAVAFVPAAVAVTQDMVHPGLRAVSLSLCVIVQHVLGSALGPPVIGALSDRFGLATAMAFLPLFAMLAGALFFIGSFFHAADSRRVEGIEHLLSSTP
jgi:MFS family permease